jgi:chromosome segregation ATPase
MTRLGAALTDEHQGTARAIKRMTQLENELKRLISAVDDRLPSLGQARPAGRGKAQAAPKPGRHGGRMVALAAVAVLSATAGFAGSSLVYAHRLQAQVEKELRPYAMELASTVTTIQTELAPNMAAADDLKAEIDRARRDLIARDQTLEATMATAESQLLSIRDAAIDDIERRLTDQTDDLTSMLDMSRKRAVELDQRLDEVGEALSAFDHQLPVLADGFSEVAAELVENRTVLDRVAEEAVALDAMAPPLLATIAEHQTGLEQGMKTLAVLQTQLENLKGQAARSSRQLEQALAQGQGRIDSWDDMDRQVGVRKQEVLRTLDLYADSLNSRVREFLEVLNNEAVFTGG